MTMTASVEAVRQNLSLVLDGGLVTPEVFHNSMRSWGATLRNEVLVWRSGIGVTRSGALVYAAGPGLSIESLADVLKHAGAVRGPQEIVAAIGDDRRPAEVAAHDGGRLTAVPVDDYGPPR